MTKHGHRAGVDLAQLFGDVTVRGEAELDTTDAREQPAHAKGAPPATLLQRRTALLLADVFEQRCGLA